MNISLTKELEAYVKEKVQSGLYQDASEVVRESLRRSLVEDECSDQDIPELANLVRQGVRSRHVSHKNGDSRRLLEKVRRQLVK